MTKCDACGSENVVQLGDTIVPCNAKEIAGVLHRSVCHDCKTWSISSTPFVYTTDGNYATDHITGTTSGN